MPPTPTPLPQPLSIMPGGRGGPWTSSVSALLAVFSSVLAAAAAEICSIDSVPKVRFCGSEEFCCGNGCCPRSMISLFKLAIGVVLLVMIMIWFCSYLRRGRHRETPWLRPPTVTPPPPYTVHGGGSANASSNGGRHPALIAYPPGCMAPPPPHPRGPAAPAPGFTTTVLPARALPDDLPPPYHTVVSMPPPLPDPAAGMGNDNAAFVPPPYLPPYDGHGKTTTGPT